MPGEAELFSELQLELAALRSVRDAWQKGRPEQARRSLLGYFRQRQRVRFDPWSLAPGVADPVPAAERLVDQNLFDLGYGYPPQRYPSPVTWSANPVSDIEWVANMHRFAWQEVLLSAYQKTHNERYAAAWVRLADDWISQHQEVDPSRFEWLDIQTGIRAAALVKAFQVLKHSASFRPDFFIRFLCALHAHARKSFLYPRTDAHNKAIIEATGLYRIGVLFPEFRAAAQWRQRAAEVLSSSLNLQTTREGVQREWSPNYHNLVASLMIDFLWLAEANQDPCGLRVRALVGRMFDYSVAMTAPDWTFPMFGDSFRPHAQARSPDNPWKPLLRAADLFRQQEWRACALGKRDHLKMGSRHFPESGMYFLRSGWKAESVYMALHCSPAAATGHDQPDNGTFELYAGGRWLMPDSGVYAYPDTPHAAERDWFRQTAVHQTLTAGRRNSQNRPRHLLWASEPGFDCVAFENESYPGLIHRRTVFRLGEQAFVLLDEAIGSAETPIELHFQFAPGPFGLDVGGRRAWTQLPGGLNVLLCASPETAVTLHPEEGQISHFLNEKQSRPALALRHALPAPVHFLTALVLFRGSPPPAQLSLKGPIQPGQSAVELELIVADSVWRVGRDLAAAKAWREPLCPRPPAGPGPKTR